MRLLQRLDIKMHKMSLFTHASWHNLCRWSTSSQCTDGTSSQSFEKGSYLSESSVDHEESHWEASRVCVPTYLARSCMSENFLRMGISRQESTKATIWIWGWEALLCLRLARKLFFSIWIHTHHKKNLNACVFTLWHHLTASYVPNGALDRHHAALGVH